MPKGWLPPKEFNLSYDHWLIPVAFVKQIPVDPTKPDGLATVSEPMIFGRPQNTQNTKRTLPVVPCPTINFHQWRQETQTWIALGAPPFNDDSRKFKRKHFELLPALKRRKKGSQHPAGWWWEPTAAVQDL